LFSCARSGQLVSKDELLQEVWPGRIVEEVSLSVNISAVP
jgi:DNA-binding winged helix-turn-helix (wHTH) protein